MKNLRLSELFSQDELQVIMTAAQAEYNVKYSHDKEGKDIYLFLLSVDYAHAAYILHQSEEYMESFNRLKATCKHSYMPLYFWEALAVKSVYEGESKTPKQAALFACVHFILED